VSVTFERTLRLRKRRIIPNDFQQRFHARLLEGRLDRGKATDYCELNPSPAARVTMAAVGRWGRSVADLERGVSLARQREVDQLWRHVGTLRRIAALAPLLGLLGTLVSVSRALSATALAAGQLNWASVVASALGPLIGGVVLAILSLVAYDGLVARVEGFERSLDRLGAETVDAIAMSTLPEPRRSEIRTDSANLPRAPHPVRVDIPQPSTRPRDRDRDEER
jgi:biopolymer transport protein ExbB